MKETIEMLKEIKQAIDNGFLHLPTELQYKAIFNAIEILENKPSIEEIRKEVELEYMRGMTGGYKNIDIISNIAKAILKYLESTNDK